MQANRLCCCCLDRAAQKELHSSYFWLDTKEVYADMLVDCFNIELSNFGETSAICDACIFTLRNAYTFKKQILKSQQELLDKFYLEQNEHNDEKVPEVKQEPKIESDDDSDDYFLADAVKFIAAEDLKLEVEEPSSTSNSELGRVKTKKRTDKEWGGSKIKLVKKLSKSMSSCDVPALTILNKNERNGYEKQTEAWLRAKEKIKHRENLLAILSYSNTIPFKDKSLVGYICWYCESTYPDPFDLRTHTESVHKMERTNIKASYDLTECNIKLDVEDLRCTLCDDKIPDLKTLKEHLVTIHEKPIHNDVKDHMIQFKLKKGEIYDCALCSATYETFKMLKQHMNKHYSNYVCTKCESCFATMRSLKAHIDTHKEGSFKCDLCDKAFASRGKKRYHEKMKHLGTRHISNCPYCNEAFRSYYQRNQHLIKVHNSEAQYKCNICDRTFILKSLLMTHIKRNHLMERNCQCSECGYRFFSKKALKAHMVKHTGERKHVCEVCHKGYGRKYTLREHMRIHNNDRRFKCKICEMSFVQKCSLKSHLLSNHGISMKASDITTEEINSEESK